MCGKFEKGEALLTEAEPSFERRGLDGWGLSTGGFEAQLNAANDRDQGRPPPQQQEPQQQQDHRLDLLSSRSSERSPQQQPQQQQQQEEETVSLSVAAMIEFASSIERESHTLLPCPAVLHYPRP